MLLKKLISYIYPIIIESRPSEYSETLEVTLVNGRPLLDSKNTNYSYGNLQKVLKKGLLSIGKETISKCESILILGVAGGSVIETLQNDFNTKAHIIGVEIDKEVISLANKYYHLDSKEGIQIIEDDAFEFIAKNKNSYDLIIVDIFHDNKMPGELFSHNFWKHIQESLSSKGTCLFNTMISLDGVGEQNELIREKFTDLFSAVLPLNAHKKHNQLFILRK